MNFRCFSQLLTVSIFIFSVTVNAGDVQRPPLTKHKELDSFVDSSFDLYDKNEYVFNRIDRVGMVTAALVTDPVGFSSQTASGSVDDAVDMVKAQGEVTAANWPQILANTDPVKLLASMDDNTREAFFSRFNQLKDDFDANEMNDSINGVAGEASRLLDGSGKLAKNPPKNPMKIKKYWTALSASKEVLKVMSKEYPSKTAALANTFTAFAGV